VRLGSWPDEHGRVAAYRHELGPGLMPLFAQSGFGVVTAAVVHLLPRPRALRVVRLAFSRERLRAALEELRDYHTQRLSSGVLKVYAHTPDGCRAYCCVDGDADLVEGQQFLGPPDEPGRVFDRPRVVVRPDKFRQAAEEWEAAVKRPIVTDEMYGIGGLETRTYNRMPAGTATPDETAAYLDTWALAHAWADGRDVGERPVSGGLARMAPLVELMSLSTGPLLEEFVSPPPHLMAEISERQAVLWERIVAGPHRTRDAKKHAAAAREKAATYRAQDAHKGDRRNPEPGPARRRARTALAQGDLGAVPDLS
jgi:hypothetical protein